MAGVHCDSAEYSHRLQLGEDVSDLQKIAHSHLEASSMAVNSLTAIDAHERQHLNKLRGTVIYCRIFIRS